MKVPFPSIPVCGQKSLQFPFTWKKSGVLPSAFEIVSNVMRSTIAVLFKLLMNYVFIFVFMFLDLFVILFLFFDDDDV